MEIETDSTGSAEHLSVHIISNDRSLLYAFKRDADISAALEEKTSDVRFASRLTSNDLEELGPSSRIFILASYNKNPSGKSFEELGRKVVGKEGELTVYKWTKGQYSFEELLSMARKNFSWAYPLPMPENELATAKTRKGNREAAFSYWIF